MAASKDTEPRAPKGTSSNNPDSLLIKDTTQGESEPAGDELKSPGTDQEGTDVGNGMPSDVELGKAMDEAEQEASKPTGKLLASKKRVAWPRKKIALVVGGAVASLIALVMIIPASRYAVAGLLLKRDVLVTLRDTKTDKPVSNAVVQLDHSSAMTDARGIATLKSVPVGSKKIKVSKKYYKEATAEMVVPITGASPALEIGIEATGRQVPVKIVHSISRQPLEGAQVSANDTSSNTDKNGEAVMVLPADKSEVEATISLNGYNNAGVAIMVTEQADDKNTFSLTPSGKLFFLSKRSGTIDVLKSNLDGSDTQTVVKGTGKEEEYSTVLLASRDWKYLALKARRDSERPKLYIIETASGKLSVMDEGDVNFSPVGWYNSHFVFSVERDKLKNWEPKHYALKSYNAGSGSLGTLDETAGEGKDQYSYAFERIDNTYILDNEVFYTKDWSTGYYPMFDGKNMTIHSVRPDGSNKKVLKSLPKDNGSYFGSARLYKPQEVYVELYEKQQRSFWEYEGGKLVEDKELSADTFYKYYPTYLLSPSGKSTFWYEPRDGKNTLFAGNADGEEAKELATLSEYTPYGWYGDEYLLVSKGGSELFVIARSTPGQALKVTDYHKPQTSFYGYGYGYGGF